MWQDSSTYSKDASTAMGSFVEASDWISKELREGEIAVVPSREVFEVLNPQLRGRLLDYQSIWHSAGVEFRERSDPKKMQEVLDFFVNLIKNNSSETSASFSAPKCEMNFVIMPPHKLR
jgi:hypothetical protein